MASGRIPSGRELGEADTLALFYLQRYGFLGLDQAARITGHKRGYVARRLLMLEQAGFVRHFGGVRIGFQGGAPKLYYLRKKGWDFLRDETGVPEDLLGSFKERFCPTWSDKTRHRMKLVDVFLALEVALRNRPDLVLERTFLDFNRVKVGDSVASETTDHVADGDSAETRIVPDGAFILSRTVGGETRRRLFFVEADCGTQTLLSRITNDPRFNSLHARLRKYDRYLHGRRFALKYAPWGSFDHFVMLLVTTSPTRVENLRQKAADLPRELASYYRLATFAEAEGGFLDRIWLTRDPDDGRRLSPLE